jgi:hypothetical protein
MHNMKNLIKPMPITFREGRSQNYVEWKQEFDNLESLRNYLRIKMIKLISLRVFVQPLEKTITLKSYVTPSDLTSENYRWLQESSLPEEKFIMVNHRAG